MQSCQNVERSDTINVDSAMPSYYNDTNAMSKEEYGAGRRKREGFHRLKGPCVTKYPKSLCKHRE